jgi:hypothetical protein
MPCCAFAAFILGQILIGLSAIKRFVLGRSGMPDDLPINPATEWLLIRDASFSNVPTTPSKLGPRIGWIAAVASLEIVLAIGGVYGLRSSGASLSPSGVRGWCNNSPRLVSAATQLK